MSLADHLEQAYDGLETLLRERNTMQRLEDIVQHDRGIAAQRRHVKALELLIDANSTTRAIYRALRAKGMTRARARHYDGGRTWEGKQILHESLTASDCLRYARLYTRHVIAKTMTIADCVKAEAPA